MPDRRKEVVIGGESMVEKWRRMESDRSRWLEHCDSPNGANLEMVAMLLDASNGHVVS